MDDLTGVESSVRQPSRKTLVKWGAKNRPIRPAFSGPTKGGDFGVTQDLLSKNGSLNRNPSGRTAAKGFIFRQISRNGNPIGDLLYYEELKGVFVNPVDS
jgi:hypothetical protein